MRIHRLQRHSGFSLIELMVTIAIVAILLAVAFPSFEGSLRSNRIATQTNELVASFALARSEALRNPGGAVICTSSDGDTCDAAATWNDGWIVWIDVDGDGLKDLPEDRTLRAITSNDRLDLTGTAAVGDPVFIAFDNRGRVRDGNRRDFVLQPDTCPAGVELRREMAVTPTGQFQTNKRSCP